MNNSGKVTQMLYIPPRGLISNPKNMISMANPFKNTNGIKPRSVTTNTLEPTLNSSSTIVTKKTFTLYKF